MLVRPLLVSIAIAAVALAGAALVRADGDQEYSITLETQPSLAVGAAGRVEISVEASAGLRISSDGPVRISVEVSPGAGLRATRRIFRRRHATDPAGSPLRFTSMLVAGTAGAYQVTFDIQFWVCGKKTCRPVRERRQVAIAVTAPAADAGPVQ